MVRFIALFVLLMGWSSASAQLVRKSGLLSQNGSDVVNLLDSTRVHAEDVSGGIYTTYVHAYVHKKHITDGVIDDNAPLVNAQKDSIGYTLRTTQADTSWASDAFRMGKYVEVVIEGRMNGNSLHFETFPVIALERFFEAKRLGNQYERLTELMTALGFVQFESENYEYWAALQDQKTPWEPLYNVIVVFRGGIPVAVVVPEGDFKHPKIKETTTMSNGTYFFLQRLNPKTIEELEDAVYTYVAL